MRIKSLSHVGITVTDFAAAVKWYHEKFGFWLVSEQELAKEQISELQELYQVKDAAVRLGFLRAPGGGVVEIFEFNPSLPGEKTIWNKPGVTHLTLDVKNVHRWYVHLKTQGVSFFSAPQITDGNEWVFLQDPDGNLIELIDLKINYPLIRIFGGIAGKIMAKRNFKKYYL